MLHGFAYVSIGMIMITLFNDDASKWHFRKTLGMGYAPNKWNKLNVKSYSIDKSILRKYNRQNLPHVLKKTCHCNSYEIYALND